MWEILLQAAFYATPIIYPMQRVLGEGKDFIGYILVSPPAQIIQDVRHVLITDDAITIWQILPLGATLIPFAIIILFSLLGVYYFKKNSKYFAEQL